METGKKFTANPFRKAETFFHDYLTDIIKEAVDNSIEAYCVQIHTGWIKIDTIKDY